MGISICGKCKHYTENKHKMYGEYEGKCKIFKIKRGFDSSSCDKIEYIDLSFTIEKVRHEGDMFE